jgi:peptide/nickel transport system ATP-binding protein
MTNLTSPDDSAPPLLAVQNLVVDYPSGRRQPVRAVNRVSFTVRAGETVGLVGESGSGKSSIGNAVLGLTPVSSGSMRFDQVDISRPRSSGRASLARRLQVVFQDPYSSLNPTRKVGESIGEVLRTTGKLPRSQRHQKIAQILERVGLSADAAELYPNSFSGGQRQRIAIARALVVEPKLVVCDEPVSALDLSVQAQVLNLLGELQATSGCSYLFISHDLAVVRHVSRRLIVLYRGKVMEEGDAAEVHQDPRHPYTRALLAAAPVPNPLLQRQQREQRAASRPDGIIDRATPGHGCVFAPRCAHATDVCRTTEPALETSGPVAVACHHWRQLGPSPTLGPGGHRQQTPRPQGPGSAPGPAQPSPLSAAPAARRLGEAKERNQP